MKNILDYLKGTPWEEPLCARRPAKPPLHVLVCGNAFWAGTYNKLEKQRHEAIAWCFENPHNVLVHVCKFGDQVAGMRADILIITTPPQNDAEMNYVRHQLYTRVKPGGLILGDI